MVWGNSSRRSLHLNEAQDGGRNWHVNVNVVKIILASVIFQITVGVDVSILDGKSVLKMLSLFFCHKSNLGACIASTGQTFSKKFEA